jgi:hypothetical protein
VKCSSPDFLKINSHPQACPELLHLRPSIDHEHCTTPPPLLLYPCPSVTLLLSAPRGEVAGISFRCAIVLSPAIPCICSRRIQYWQRNPPWFPTLTPILTAPTPHNSIYLRSSLSQFLIDVSGHSQISQYQVYHSMQRRRANHIKANTSPQILKQSLSILWSPQWLL